jgi:FkbM family methyltransferase
MVKWITYQFRKAFRPKNVRCGTVRLHIGRLAKTSYAKAFYRDSHERFERRVIQQHLEADDRVLEAGSGIGLIATVCCQIVGSENVATYEANPDMEDLLRETFALNGVAPDLQMKMISEQAGAGTFYQSDRFIISSHIKPTECSKALSVPSISFSEAIKKHKPTFVICDIEGGEVQLADESIDLSGVQKLCIEIHPKIAGDFATSNLIRSLLNKGFTLNLTESENDVLFFRRAA